MMKKTLILCSFVFTLFCLPALAQKQSIKGLVTDNKGTALEGVTVKNSNTKAATTSNKNGTFSITANSNDMLSFSFVGFETTTVKYTSGELKIVLTPSTTELQEVVLVGSRGLGRVKTESPVPVDVIKISEVGLNTARMDLTSTLNFVAPSFNYNKQSGADGADHVDLFRTRRGDTPLDGAIPRANGGDAALLVLCAVCHLVSVAPTRRLARGGTHPPSALAHRAGANSGRANLHDGSGLCP